MNAFGIKRSNYHDADTFIDGSLTLSSGTIVIPKYDAEIDELKRKTQYQDLGTSSSESELFKPEAYLEAVPKNFHRIYGMIFTPAQTMTLKYITLNLNFIVKMSQYNVRQVDIFDTETKQQVKAMLFNADNGSDILNVDYVLTANKQYMLSFNVLRNDVVQYLDGNTLNNNTFDLINVQSFVGTELNMFGYPTIPIDNIAPYGFNVMFEYNSQPFTAFNSNLHLQENKLITLKKDYYDTEYTGTIANLSQLVTWGWTFTCSKANMSLRTLKIKVKYLNWIFRDYFPSRTITLYDGISPHNVIKTWSLILVPYLNDEDYQTIDLNINLEKDKRYTLAINLMYFEFPFDPNNPDNIIFDKVGTSDPPTIEPALSTVITNFGYAFHTGTYAYPLAQTLPVTKFYLFNVEFEESNVPIVQKKDLICQSIYSKQFFQYFDNPLENLEFGDLVCFDSKLNIVKTDYTIPALPIGIFYGLENEQAKVLVRGSVGYCKILGGCIVNDELGMSVQSNEQGKCQKNGARLFGIAMEVITDEPLVMLLLI